MEYDLLVYLGLGGILLVITIAALVLERTPELVSLEARKIRCAVATFTGILMLLVFTSILYFVDESAAGRGKEICDRTAGSLTPNAGAVVGYVFSLRPDPPSGRSDSPARGWHRGKQMTL